jgi:hypothetical protein
MLDESPPVLDSINECHMESRTQLPKRTVKVKVTDDSKIKLELLNSEYRSFQAYLQGNKQVKFSATRQQADTLLNRIVKHGGKLNPKKQYPLILSKNCGLNTNADYNGSRNILQRALGILSKVGGTLTIPCRQEQSDHERIPHASAVRVVKSLSSICK